MVKIFKKKERKTAVDYISEDLCKAAKTANAEEKAIMANSKVKAKSVNGVHLYEWTFGVKKVVFNGTKGHWIRENGK